MQVTPAVNKNTRHSTSEWSAPAVVKQQMDDDSAASLPTIFGELIEFLDIPIAISQMPQ
jgi:hypothetical protein